MMQKVDEHEESKDLTPEKESSIEIPMPPMGIGQQGRQLTECSAKYDLTGKGYLDETERALRSLDASNKGFLDMDKVYSIMRTLQLEQEKSQELIDGLRKESKKAMTMKRLVLGLAGFAVLLAVANIGTSFAAARLAKDTTVSDSSDLIVISTGARAGTTSKLVEVEMQPVDASTRRRLSRQLRDLEEAFCGDVVSGGTGSCTLQGQMYMSDAEALYQQFCPGWNANVAGYVTCGGGSSQVILSCGTKSSTVFGGMFLPSGRPTVTSDSVTFPTQGGHYQAQQRLTLPDATFSTPSCVQGFNLGMYCFTDGTPCLVFSAWESVCQDVAVELCDATTTA